MSPPRFLDRTVCPYSFNQHLGLADVETGGVGIITDLRAYLVALGWTEPSANLFKSPSDVQGRWFDVLCTRISATNIEFRVRDHLGHTIITRRIQIDSSNASVNYFCGKFYVIVESLRSAEEIFQAFIPDTSPSLDRFFPFAVFATALRSSADSSDGNGNDVSDLYGWESTAVVQRGRLMTATQLYDNSTNPSRFFPGGPFLTEGARTANPGDAIDITYIGRRWHTFCTIDYYQRSSEKPMEVDDNLSATFRVLGLAAVGTARLIVRVSDP